MSKNGIVVVTYNRLELLRICIQHIKDQSVQYDEVIVIDNHSDDGTAEYLSTEKDLTVKRTERNLGGAGGFAYGVKIAHEKKCDWITLIDDDAILNKYFLESIIKKRKECPEVQAMAATVKTNEKIMLQFARRITENRRDKELYIWNVPLSEYEKSMFFCDLCTFCGLSFSSNLINVIGYPSSEYFISHDDTEYCLRIRKYTKIAVVTDAIIDHRTKPSSKGGLDWKRYYSIRNTICETRKHFGMAFAWKKTQSYISQINRYVNDNSHVREVKKMMRTAVIDAWIHKMGRHKVYSPHV